MTTEERIENAAREWLRANDWDYQKYGDRRPDRSAYDGLMNYEITPWLGEAFADGAKLGIQIERERSEELVKALETIRLHLKDDFSLFADQLAHEALAKWKESGE